MSLTKLPSKNIVPNSMNSCAEIQLSEKPTKKVVLDEDSYEKNLEKIIQRDFFPDLERMKAQSEYIEAAQRNDKERMNELMVKYRVKTGLRTPSATPSTFETPNAPSMLKPSPPRESVAAAPSSLCSSMEPPQEETSADVVDAKPVDVTKPVEASDLPLDKYLSNYTSEDTESFEKLMEESERRKQMKYSWLFEQEAEHERRYEKRLSLPSFEVQAITDTNSKSGGADNWTYKAKNAIMYAPEGTQLSAAEQQEVVKKSEQAIVHSNTRFTRKPFDDAAKKQSMVQAAASQAAANQGKVGVDGKELLPVETPRVAGFSFVATPSPAPGVTDESPLMTWGEIEGTPFRLDAPDTPILGSETTPQFKIPNVPKRDCLALSLAEKASAQHRKKKEEALRQASATFSSSQSPSFGSQKSMDRLRNMSPAAQRLASSKLGVRVGTDKALRESYTPSPCRRSSSPRTPANIISSYRSTVRSMRSEDTPGGGALIPSDSRPRRSRMDTNTVDSLTDDLLQIGATSSVGVAHSQPATKKPRRSLP